MSDVKSWGNNNNDQPKKEVTIDSGNQPDILGELLGEPSLFNSTRDILEVGETVKSLRERLERFHGQTLSNSQRAIMPEVQELSKQVCDLLPGLVMHVNLGGDVLALPVLFISSKLTNEMETFDMPTATGIQSMSNPVPPNGYITPELVENVRRLYTNSYNNEGKVINSVNVIACRLVDLDQYKDAMWLLTDNRAERIEMLAKELMATWYKGVLSHLTQRHVSTGRGLPTPFVNGKPFGNDGAAIVRVEPLRESITVDGQLTPYNITTRMVTTNPNSTRAHRDNSKSVIDSFATVSLVGQSLMSFNSNPARGMNSMMPNPATGMPMGYQPFIPVVVYGESNPGQTMGENSGLGTFFMGLHSLLTTNTRQLFSEPLRLSANGNRGNLCDMENRIASLVASCNVRRPAETLMDEKKMRDADFVTNWIFQYVAQNAAFAVDLVNFSRNSQETNFLMSTLQADTKERAMRIAVAVIDSLTKGKMSELISKPDCPWKMSDGMLINSNIMIPHGVFKYDNKWVDMGEIDEMFLSRVYKNDQAKVIEILSKIYGSDTNMDAKARRLFIRRALNELTDNQLYLNGYKTRAFFNSKFLEVFTNAMNSIGAVMVNGTVGNYMTAPIAFDQISQFITTASAGAIGFNNNNIIQPGGIVFGMGQH